METCPPEDEILRGLLDELPSEARAGLTAHLAGCDRCRERWRQHRSLGYGSSEPDPSEPSATPCSQPADVEALVRGLLDPDAGRTARIHILSCPHCYARLDDALHQERRRRHGEGTVSDETHGKGGLRRWLRRLGGGSA